MNKDLELLKKRSLMSLELSTDKKTQVTNAEITTFVQKVKQVVAKKDIVIVVLEHDES
jgi:hypothetical protein